MWGCLAPHLAGAPEEKACDGLLDLIRAKDLGCDHRKHALLRVGLACKRLERLDLCHVKLRCLSARVLLLPHPHDPAGTHSRPWPTGSGGDKAEDNLP